MRGGIILAGGTSTRMGKAKALLPLGGETLLARAWRLLAPLCREVIVVTSNPASLSFPGAKIVGDLFPGCGPLGGIHSGLVHSSFFYNFVLAVDLPFVSPALVDLLFGKAVGFDAAVPQVGGYFEPLCGVYAKSCLPAVEEALARGKRKVTAFYPRVGLRVVREEELAGVLTPETFFNLNTPLDWERAKCLLSSLSWEGQK